MADPRSLDDAVEALEALRALASLPERRRTDLALKVAGYSYEEIRAHTPADARCTNVNKSLVKARARIRQMRRRTGDAASERPRQEGGPIPALVPLWSRWLSRHARSETAT